MKTAKEILIDKAIQKDDGFLSGQVGWIVEAMEEYAKKPLSIEDITLNDVVYYFPFCIWLNENGWENYVDPEMWICCSEGNNVRHIKELFEEFKIEVHESVDSL